MIIWTESCQPTFLIFNLKISAVERLWISTGICIYSFCELEIYASYETNIWSNSSCWPDLCKHSIQLVPKHLHQRVMRPRSECRREASIVDYVYGILLLSYIPNTYTEVKIASSLQVSRAIPKLTDKRWMTFLMLHLISIDSLRPCIDSFERNGPCYKKHLSKRCILFSVILK